MLSGDKPFRLQGCPEARMLSRDKKSYDNMLGNAYAQVAISTTVCITLAPKCKTVPLLITS